MEQLEAHRTFFAKLITAKAGVAPGSDLEIAFASTPREQFVEGPPWKIFTPVGYLETPSSNPAFLYQDVVVSLNSEGPINNGEPTLHARCLATLAPQRGEKVVHIGAGTGYYTTLLAKMVGNEGRVEAFEIDAGLAQRASENLSQFPQVRVHCQNGATGPLPQCDVLYVNAGATAPMPGWIDALTPGGRLLFPLTPDVGIGGMLLVKKAGPHSFKATFLMLAQFIPCIGARTESEAKRLTKAFLNGGWDKVRSLHRDDTPDSSCWVSGFGWWLSTR